MSVRPRGGSPGRGARSRPARRPRTNPRASPGPAEVTSVGRGQPAPRRTPLTTRAALLGVVISALAVLLALPLRTYLGQRGDITALATAQAQQRHRIDLLHQQVARAQTPAVIEQQARQRLQLTFPGQTDYVVVDPPRPPAPPPPRDRPTTVVPADPHRPWWSALWESTGTAGQR